MKRGREEQSNDNSRLAEMMPLASAVRRTPPSRAPEPHRHADCASTDRAPAVDKARRPIQFSPAHIRRAMVPGSAIGLKSAHAQLFIHGAVLRALSLRLVLTGGNGLGHALAALLAHPLPRVRMLRQLNPGKRRAANGPLSAATADGAGPRAVLCCGQRPLKLGSGPRTPFALRPKLSHVSITSASAPPSAPRSTPRATPAGPRPSPAGTPARRPRAAG